MIPNSSVQFDNDKKAIEEEDSQQSKADLRVTSRLLIGFLLIGVFVLSLQNVGAKLPAVLWALAWLATGAMIGFLFGIPRVLQQADVKPPQNPPPGSPTPTSPASDETSSYKQQVNTNLEQISDWLTKIIVGIGLVELRRLPDLLNRVSRFMAVGFAPTPQAQVLAAGIVIYFSILGFLSGYLLTRIYLSGAFRRADTGSLLVGGIATPISKLFSQLINSVTDLRKSGTGAGGPPASSAPSTGADARAGRTRLNQNASVLWVDDHFENNSLLIYELQQRGIHVVPANSTQVALSRLSGEKFSVIITDMGRDAEGPTAGIDLVRRVRQTNQVTPIIIYCSPQSVEVEKDEAMKAGATEITSSQTQLLDFIYKLTSS